MYRTAVSRLSALKGGRRYPTRFASSSAAAALQSSSSSGLFSWLTGGKSKSLSPLDFPLQGVELPSTLPDYVEPGVTKITTLGNGLRIASETSPSPVASIGLYVDCGSVYESPATFGTTHLLERMAFKSTRNRSHLRVVREVEAIGGAVQSSASREQMGYTYDALKTYLPEMVELLIDCVRNPVFLDWEVNEQKVKAEISEASKNPQGVLLEAIHSAGFSGGLANPLLAPESSIDRLNGSLLEEFVVENYTAPRMVLAASGVEHEELVAIAEPLLSDLPDKKSPGEPESYYTGGDFRCQADSGDQKTHFALAFGLKGGWHDVKEAITLTVLQVLMGGGGSFSAGGPGKGMYSRLYQRVLNRYHKIQLFSAFNNIYNHTAVFGIEATTDADFASSAIELVVRELTEVASSGAVDPVQLQRAKQSTKSAILMNLESRMVVSEDIGRQILTYNKRKPLEDFLKAVDEVTLQDITEISQKLVSSPLTMASYGEVINVPTYDAVSSMFKSK
ncbi:mitochondrial-processing peptidase subunit alpha isoform X2 [Populus alba]|uniref:mitochondrial-processing peptidase subunit alpha isoform X2 n=1 Tax=Populus alba TaxID=43335 RepID=UPI00158D312E|nr:mitochondrial-processing peptidase subunit alpha-like isoform X2 [Populus alba]